MTIWLVCVCQCVCSYVCVCLRGRRDSCIGSGIDLHAEKSQGLFDYTSYSAALRSLVLNSQTAFNLWSATFDCQCYCSGPSVRVHVVQIIWSHVRLLSLFWWYYASISTYYAWYKVAFKSLLQWYLEDYRVSLSICGLSKCKRLDLMLYHSVFYTVLIIFKIFILKKRDNKIAFPDRFH